MTLGTIYSNPMYNFWNSSVPCTQQSIIIIRLSTAHFCHGSHGTCRCSGYLFFNHPGHRRCPFLKSQTVCLKTLQKTQIWKFVIFSLSNFRCALSISKVSTLRWEFFFFFSDWLVFYLESLSDCIIKIHVIV